MLQQSQRLRREPNSHNAAGAAKHWPARASSEQWCLASTKTKTSGTLGPASNTHSGTNMGKPQRLTPGQGHHPANYVPVASSGSTACFGGASTHQTTHAQRHREQRRASAVFSWHARGHHHASQPRLGAAQHLGQPDPLRQAPAGRSRRWRKLSFRGQPAPASACRLPRTLGCTVEEAMQCSSKVSAFGVSRTPRRGRSRERLASTRKL